MTGSNASDPYLVALRLLTGRSYGEQELRRKLEQRGHSAEGIATALTRCRELGYLDDARYAQARAAALARSGRGVGRRALLDLTQRGIDRATAAAAVAAATDEHDPAGLIRALLTRRFPGYDPAAAPPGETQRLVNFFLRRGFELPLVLSILKNKERLDDR